MYKDYKKTEAKKRRGKLGEEKKRILGEMDRTDEKEKEKKG